MDSAYLICYAFGNYMSGMLGDVYPLRFVVPIGMYLSVLGFGVIALLGYLDNENVWAFIVLWGWQGFAQSTVWPNTVALMANWFGSHRGIIIGLWSSNVAVGNIVGAQVAALILTFDCPWELVVIITSSFVAVSATAYIIIVRDKPEQVFVEDMTNSLNEKPSRRRLGFWTAWKLPGVLIYSISYACVKLLNYGLLMWLPYFFEDVLDVSGEALGGLANVYDVGGIIGAFFFGWVSDRYGYRTPIIEGMLMAGIPMLAFFTAGSSSFLAIYYPMCFVTGLFIAGAAHLISSAVSADLGKNDDIPTQVNVVSTVSGIIDGTGSMGAGIGTFTLGQLAYLGWLWPFLFLICMAATAVLLLLTRAMKEFRIKRSTEE